MDFDASAFDRLRIPRRHLLFSGTAAGLCGCAGNGRSLRSRAVAGPHKRFGDVVRRFRHGATLVDFQVSEAADRVVGLALFDRNIYVWRLSDGEVVSRTLRKKTTSRQTIAFINGGRQFVTVPTDRTPDDTTDNAYARVSAFSVFDSATGSLVRNVPSQMPSARDGLQALPGEPEELHASRDGTVLIGVYEGPSPARLAVFDTDSLLPLRTYDLYGLTQTVANHGALSADGSHVVIAGEKPAPKGKSPRQASVISLRTGKVLSRVGPFPGSLVSIALSPDPGLAVMSNAIHDNSIYSVPMPDERTQVRVVSFAGRPVPPAADLRTNAVQTLDWSGDGTLIAAYAIAPAEVVLLDPATLSVLDVCPAEDCNRVRFLGQGSQVAYTNNNQVILRDLN